MGKGCHPSEPSPPQHPRPCPLSPNTARPGPPPAARGCNRSRGRNTIPGSGSRLGTPGRAGSSRIGGAELSPGRDRTLLERGHPSRAAATGLRLSHHEEPEGQVQEGRCECHPWGHGDTGTCSRVSVGTRRPALGCLLGHEDVGISPRMPPVSQGHGDLPWDTEWSLTTGTAAPRRLALPLWLVGSNPQCTPSAPRAIAGSGAEQRRGKQLPGPLPVPLLGTSAALPAATARGTSLSMLLNYSAAAWHGAAEGRGGQRCPQCTGRDTGGDVGTQFEAPHPESGGPSCSGCSMPQFPHTALDTSLRGSRCPAATPTARTASGDPLRFGVPP